MGNQRTIFIMGAVHTRDHGSWCFGAEP